MHNFLFRRGIFPAFIILAMLMFSCRTPLNIERPPEAYQEPAVPQTFSDITLPFETEVSKIEKLVNRQFQGVIYNDTSYRNNDNDDLKITAWKAGEIKLSMQGNEIIYKVPLNLWIKKRTSIGAFGLSYTDEREVTGGVALKFRTKISVRKDWTIATLTTSVGYEWLKQPAVKVGPVSFPLGFIADMLINANQKTINKEIDRAFQSSFEIRKMMTDVWMDLQKPVRIEGNYPLWLKINPKEVRMVQAQAVDGRLRFAVGIKTMTDVFYSETAPQYVENTRLPDIIFTSRLDNDFTVNLMADIPFTRLDELANQSLKGYTLKQGKYTVKVDTISLYGNGENLVVAAKISGSADGTVYFTGNPYFDPETQSLKVRDLDFDVRTKNVLVKSAQWLFHNGLLQSVQSKLEFPAAEQLSDARKQIQDALNENSSFDMFRLSGSVDKVDIGDIYITRAGVKGVFRMKGRVKFTLESSD